MLPACCSCAGHGFVVSHFFFAHNHMKVRSRKLPSVETATYSECYNTGGFTEASSSTFIGNEDFSPSQDCDYFHYRWRWIDDTSSICELYCPWSGETIGFDDETNPEDLDAIHRSSSMWRAPGDQEYNDEDLILLQPVQYLSRNWGRREFKGWRDSESAATHIGAVIRGFIARRRLRQWFRLCYRRCLCPDSGYYYFRDIYKTNEPSSWYKPRLARIEDMLVSVIPVTALATGSTYSYDFQDLTQSNYSNGEGTLVPAEEEYDSDVDVRVKLTEIGFVRGPFWCVSGRGKTEKSRSKLSMGVFLVPNERRRVAMKRIDEIDLEQAPLGSVIAWMDSQQDVSVIVDDYLFMRAVVEGNAVKEDEISLRSMKSRKLSLGDGDKENRIERVWVRILRAMTLHEVRPLTQMYGMYALAKTPVPVASDGVLNYAAAEALQRIVDVADYHNPDTIYTYKTFAMHALANILEAAGGRTEFFSVHKAVVRDGEDRGSAVRKHLSKKLEYFAVFLRNVQLEGGSSNSKDDASVFNNEPHKSVNPSRRGVDLTELCLKCLSFIARDEGNRELLATVVVEDAIRAMLVCAEDGMVAYWGLRLMYNICYRSEAGAEILNEKPTVKTCIEVIKYNHSGDSEVIRQIERLERSLKPDGWRGNVENDIEDQMLKHTGRDRNVRKEKKNESDTSKNDSRSRSRSRSEARRKEREAEVKAAADEKARKARMDSEKEEKEKARADELALRNNDIIPTYKYAFGNPEAMAEPKVPRKMSALTTTGPRASSDVTGPEHVRVQMKS